MGLPDSKRNRRGLNNEQIGAKQCKGSMNGITGEKGWLDKQCDWSIGMNGKY
jgi:hypothetical protein